jgi:hypothetical protein
MTDTSDSATDVKLAPAKTIETAVRSETHVSSKNVPSVPFDHNDEGSVKLRLSSREMPNIFVDAITK